MRGIRHHRLRRRIWLLEQERLLKQESAFDNVKGRRFS